MQAGSIEVLDIFVVGETVNLTATRNYIPPTVFQIFEKAITRVEGQKFEELSDEQKKLVKMVVELTNEYLYIEVFCGSLKDSIKTERLARKADSHARRIFQQKQAKGMSDEELQKEEQKNRRARFDALREIVAICTSEEEMVEWK